MPVPYGKITESKIWHREPEAVEEVKKEQCECDDGCEGCKDVESEGS